MKAVFGVPFLARFFDPCPPASPVVAALIALLPSATLSYISQCVCVRCVCGVAVNGNVSV